MAHILVSNNRLSNCRAKNSLPTVLNDKKAPFFELKIISFVWFFVYSFVHYFGKGYERDDLHESRKDVESVHERTKEPCSTY